MADKGDTHEDEGVHDDAREEDQNWDNNADQTYKDTCPCCGGTGTVDVNIPDWARFAMTEEGLYSFCKNNGIDDAACRQACCLIQQYDEDGRKGVAEILSTTIHRFKNLDNPSAYFANSCMKWKEQKTKKHYK